MEPFSHNSHYSQDRDLGLVGCDAIRMPERRGSNHPPSPKLRRGKEDRGKNCGLRIFQLKTVSQFVIPAKSRKAGREPGSRKNWTIDKSRWIPDLVRLSGLVRNDDFYGLNDFYESTS
jgi:hypothetical protein